MTIAKDAAFRRALKRYADAVEAKAFEGAIPRFSDDREEQAALDAAHREIDFDLKHTERLLVALIDRRINRGTQ